MHAPLSFVDSHAAGGASGIGRALVEMLVEKGYVQTVSAFPLLCMTLSPSYIEVLFLTP